MDQRLAFLQQLALSQSIERPLAGYQLFIGPGLDNAAALQHQDAVGVTDRAEAMGDEFPKDSRSIFDRSVWPDMASQRRWYMLCALHRMIVSLY